MGLGYQTIMDTVSALHALLPQTQCRECGYPDCKSYANALANNTESNIGLCAPGGEPVLENIAALLDSNSEQYRQEVIARFREPNLVKIREEDCIGCTKCISACPVDAIIGASKQMHTVLSDICTGCGLCIPPCPVDCIDVTTQSTATYSPNEALKRYEAKEARLQKKIQDSHTNFQNIQSDKQSQLRALLSKIKHSNTLP